MEALIPATLASLRVALEDLVPYGDNPRRGDVRLIADSLKVNGQYRPVVVRSGTNEVLAGNHTVAAARSLGWDEIAATFVDCSDEEAARIVLVDNRANDVASYDNAVLAELLQTLPDLEGTGFTDADLAGLLSGDEPVALTDPDEVPPTPLRPVSCPGDVWQIGPHRLVCGDSTDAALIAGAFGDDVASVMWTDPPYGVDYVGGTKDALTIQNDGAEDLDELLAGFLAVASVVLRRGAPFYIAHPAGPLSLKFTNAVVQAGWGFRQQLVWVKNALVLGRSDYHYQHEPLIHGVTAYEEDHEPVLYGFTKGGKGRLGRGGPDWHGDNRQTTVFEVPKPKRNGEHPTMKPVQLIREMIRNSAGDGALVYDPFGGSGSTMIAAHHERMRSLLVELDPKYADVICRRVQEHTGEVPRLLQTGKTHDFTVARGAS